MIDWFGVMAPCSPRCLLLNELCEKGVVCLLLQPLALIKP